MTVRKNEVSCWSMRILNLVCIGCAGWFLAALYPFSSESMPLCWLLGIVCAVMLLLIFVNPWNEKLHIDDRGIRCLRRDRVLWSLSREEIAEIRPITVHRCRGYQIVLKNAPVQDLSRPGCAPVFTFEHTRNVRAALEKYGYIL